MRQRIEEEVLHVISRSDRMWAMVVVHIVIEFLTQRCREAENPHIYFSKTAQQVVVGIMEEEVKLYWLCSHLVS